MNHLIYRVVGSLYLILGAPSLVFWLTGRIQELHNDFLIISIGGIPLGFMLLMFGFGKFPMNRLSNMALRFAIIALSANVPLLISLQMARLGFGSFQSGITFSALLITLASLASFIFINLAVLKGHSRRHARLATPTSVSR